MEVSEFEKPKINEQKQEFNSNKASLIHSSVAESTRREMKSTVEAVREFIKKEVPDWDDEVIATARFKQFSGQRPEWEPKYFFWRDLILKVSRHLGLFILRPSQIKNEWFNRDGLTPLCLDRVLLLMYSEGEIVRSSDIADPTSARLFQLYRKLKSLMIRSVEPPEAVLEDSVIVTSLLKEKAAEVIKVLSESHWTTSCVITMKNFQDICGGSVEASAVLSSLSEIGKAKYLSVTKKETIEGVKISLSQAPVTNISPLDADILHLVWTTEKLQQQIDVLDQRYEASRKLVLTFLNSGNKKVALKHLRESKLTSESREKCSSLLIRLEEVLTAIMDAESTKKVSEAIQVGAQAMKQNSVTVEEVQNCLDEVAESIDSQKQVEKALESTPYSDFDEDDIEEEFQKLQSEMENELQDSIPENKPSEQTDKSDSADALNDAFSSLKLHYTSRKEPANTDSGSGVSLRNNLSKHPTPEAA